MKKYDMSKIMRRAWVIKRRAYSLPFSECLKRAWDYAKFYVEKHADDTTTTVFTNGMSVSWGGYVRTLNRWTKGTHDRVYINYGKKSDGFVDLKTRVASIRGNYTYQTKIVDMILAMNF